MEWWERLEKARKDADLSRAELARRTGVTREALQRYSRGEVDNPRGNTLAKLADALKVITGRQGRGWRFGQYNPEGPWDPPCAVETVHRIFPPLELYLF